MPLLLLMFGGASPESPTLEECFKEIVQEAPKPPASQTDRRAAREYVVAHQFAAEDQHQFAIAHFRKCAELDTLSAAPWAGMAISFSATGRNDSALIAWNEVLARDPLHKDALLILGLDAARMGHVEKGKQYLSTHWLTADTIPLEQLLRIAALLSVYESNEQISELLEETVDQIVSAALYDLVSRAPSSAWLGVIQQLVDLDAIEIVMQLTVRAIPFLQEAELGTLLTVLPVLEASSDGNGSATLSAYEQIASAQPIPLAPRWFEPVPLAEALSIAAQSMSIISTDSIGPILLYRSSLALDPLDALTMNNLAWILLERDGPTQEVQKLSTKALELDPEAPYILDTVGWMHTLLGDTNKGIPMLLQSLEKSEQPSVGTYDHLGDAYWLANQKENAIESWDTAYKVLHTAEFHQGVLEGYAGLAHTVWGVSVLTPEALYDLEFGELARRLKEKRTAIQEGIEPTLGFSVPTNGAN